MKSSLGGLLRRPDRSPSPSGFAGGPPEEHYNGARPSMGRSVAEGNGNGIDVAANGSARHVYGKSSVSPQQPDAYAAALSGAGPSGGPQAPQSGSAQEGGDAYMAAMGGDWWKAWNNMEASRGATTPFTCSCSCSGLSPCRCTL